MSYKIATKRMWLRRWNRIWAFIGLIVLSPFRLVVWYISLFRRDDKEAAVWMTLLFIAIIAVTFMIRYNTAGQQYASPEVLKIESEADSCFKGTMARRIANWQRPARVFDVDDLKIECVKYWINQKAMEAQNAAMQDQLKASK